MAVAVKKAPSRPRVATRQPHFVQGALQVDGRETWKTYRVYNTTPNVTADALAVGCAAHLERLAREGDFPGEVLPTRMRVVTLTDLLDEGPDALHFALEDLLRRSCRKHVISIKGRGKKTAFA